MNDGDFHIVSDLAPNNRKVSVRAELHFYTVEYELGS
jgi:hypothetical protein